MNTVDLREKALNMIAGKMLERELKEERLTTLLNNFIVFINTEYLQGMNLEEKIELLQDEIGFTDEEIDEVKGLLVDLFE